MTEPHRHEWQGIIAELEARDWTIYKIATRLGVQYLQVQRLKEGGRAEYAIGAALLELHRTECSTRNITNVS